METTSPPKSTASILQSNILVRFFSFCVLVFLARFAYIISDVDAVHLRRSYYTSVFRNLITEGFLSTNSNSLCIATQQDFEIDAMKETGVASTTRHAEGLNQPFKNHTFDFIFSSSSGFLWISKVQVQFSFEVSRILKPGGYFVVHTESASDAYSFNSLIQLLDTFTLIKSHEINGMDSSSIWELVFKKENKVFYHTEKGQITNGMILQECSVPRHKLELIEKAEPLIEEEPLKPRVALKRNIKNVKYLSRMVDISFRNRYVYVNVGARNYGSSIGGWFKKQYPKQEKPFEIYAIEANSAFHNEYTSKKGVTLLPYVAWLRNETLFFEISREPSRKNKEQSRGMGRVQSASNFISDSNKIQGFDFAMWLKSSVTSRDYVVVKMDIEGTEFHLIPHLIETRAVCLIDEMFLECHYNRWPQRCKRSPCKYQKTYAQCLELFSALRRIGVLVHQWC